MSATFDYGHTQATAKRMLSRFGRAMILRSVTTGAYVDGDATQSSVDQVVVGLVDEYTIAEMTGGLIERNDRKVTLAASDLSGPPDTSDILVMGSIEYKVVNVNTVSPGGVDVLYVVQARA